MDAFNDLKELTRLCNCYGRTGNERWNRPLEE